MKNLFYLLIFIFLLVSCDQKHVPYTKTKNGIIYETETDSLVISVLSDNMIGVKQYTKPYEKKVNQVPIVLPVNDQVDWKIEEARNGIEIITNKIIVAAGDSCKITFYNKNGNLLTSAFQNDVAKLKQSFTCADEAIYGLGQYQNGLLDLKNAPIRLKQFNQEVANPFMVSTKGYGILWNNTSVTDFNFPEYELKFSQVIDLIKNIQKATFTPKQSGLYHFGIESLNKKRRLSGPILLTFNGDTVIHYNTLWVPEFHSGAVNLIKGKSYEVIFTNTNAQEPGRVFYNEPDFNKSTFKSKYGNGIEYYLIAGKPNEVIAGYRKLTGTAPMFDKSVYGFWQCRERYHSQEELLINAREYRKRKIPVDNIVQDWNYWPKGTWGPEWDRKLYPDPQKMCDALDDMHLNLMVSVWPRITNRPLEDRYNLSNNIINKYGNLDFFNPQVRKDYYRMLKDSMFNIGVKSIWLDGTEPENYPREAQTDLGPFVHNALAYSLMVTRSVYEGHRRDYPNERVFNLARSAIAGQQRFSACVWSGDVSATWEQFDEQITAGLNFSMSGLPYWTTDIGGFFRDNKSANPQYDNQYTNKEYKELLTRWFQFGTFCPVFRIHGYKSETEIWRYGKTFEDVARKFIDLRYMLMPYIYSTADEVTVKGAPFIKPLAYDYSDDQNCWDIKDQFLFGNSLMVCPVTKKGARKRNVYLPKGNWVGFWNGKEIKGGTTVVAEAPLRIMPIYVKAGSILPVGPKVQYAMQQSTEPMQILIYPGADGRFELYEDEGENVNYEQGYFSNIEFKWNDADKILTIEDRKGDFKGMPVNRKFEIVLVKNGFGNDSGRAKRISYNGSMKQIKL